MKLTEFDDVDWVTSPERIKAQKEYMRRLYKDNNEAFDQSKEFANARHAYRRRVNGTD